MTEPTLRLQSCGVGVQSTTLSLLSIEGHLPRLDGVIFADTGWEPAAVYAQADRLERAFTEAGVPFYRVSQGNLRADAIDPEHRFASVPYYVRNPAFEVDVTVACSSCEGTVVAPDLRNPDPYHNCWTCGGAGVVPTGEKRPATEAEREGMGRRQCTSEYKLSPINRKVRELLGAKPPKFRTVPRGRVAEQWIGFSTDEVHRVSDRDGVRYLRPRYPLLELKWSRKDCERYLASRGWGETVKSACIGCPFHGNQQWRDLRDNHPEEWADAVTFDEAIRKGGARGLPLDGEAFLHRSRVPLGQAPIDHVTSAEWRGRQGNLLDVIDEQGDPDGCSPYGCRSGEPVVA